MEPLPIAGLLTTCPLFFTLPEAVWKWIHGLGGPGLILWGIADNSPVMSAPPGSIDVFVILLATDRHGWWAYYALMATIGEVIGGYLTYRLATKGGHATLEKKVGKIRAQKIYKVFEKHGSATVLVGSLLPPPFPFTPVVVTAGVMQYPTSKFLGALSLGRALRFFIAAGLGRAYGQQMISMFSAHYDLMVHVCVFLAITAGVGAAIYFGWYRPRTKREEDQHSQTSSCEQGRDKQLK